MAFSFGLSSKKGKQSSNENVNRDRTIDTTSTKTGTSEGTKTDTQTVRQLDEGTTAVLQGLVQQLAGSAGGAAGGNPLSQELLSRARTTEADLGASFAPILQQAERQGTQDIERLMTQLAAATGSSQNTYVAGAGAEANADLQSELAALGSQLQLGAREAADSAYGLAAQTGANETTQLAQLADVLRGATVQSEGTSATKTSSSEELKTLEVLTELINSVTQQKSKSSGFSLGF